MKIVAKRKIGAPAQKIWPYLSDFANIYRFHPLVKESQIIEGEGEIGIGFKRECRFEDGNYSKEVITDWDEGCSYTVDIFETSLPIEQANATLGVLPLQGESSQLYMVFNLKPKNFLMAPLMYLMFRYSTAPNILKDLAQLYNLESAQQVPPAAAG